MVDINYLLCYFEYTKINLGWGSMKKAGIFILIVALCLLLTACGEQKAYDEACALFENGSYAEAIEMFRALGDYSDCSDRVKIAQTRLEQTRAGKDASVAAAEKAARYSDAFTFIEQGRTREAYACFSSLGDYRDAAAYLDRFTVVKGALVREEVHVVKNGEDTLRGTAEYSYGADGRALTRSGFCKLDKYGWFEDFDCLYSYNDAGLVSRIEAVNTNDTLRFTISYEYDENGCPVRELYSDSYGKSHEYEYVYSFVDATDSSESYTEVAENEMFNGNAFPQSSRQEKYCQFGVASVKGDGYCIVNHYGSDGKRSESVRTEADGSKTVTEYFYEDVFVYTPAA